ncbi:MAG: hypothetical protein KTR31_25385 [Myxococcales bacterium]|nr:hypothetical protein [Myxococcales bacterium]
MSTDLTSWAWWRALMITSVIAVHGIFVAPVPHVVTPQELTNPVSRDEVRRWAERFTALGYAISAEELGERVVDVSGVVGGSHRKLKAPFRPLLRFTGTGQGWALFANPDTHPGRLNIRVKRQGGRWEHLYLQLDPELDWWKAPLSYRRLRGCWDESGFRRKPRAMYRRFAHWVADRIFAIDPEVTTVQVRTLRTHTTLPGEPGDDSVKPYHALTVQRPQP